MAFRKNSTIYESKGTKVYINQCHNPGKKTKLFAIRRNDKRALGDFLGIIKWDGAWWQYVTTFEPGTKWSAGCKEEIAKFEREINKREKARWKK